MPADAISLPALQAEILQSADRIAPFIRRTPLDEALALSQLGGDEVYLKQENLQHTGSFKLRGAFNKVLSLAPDDRARGVVTASSGNHGAAVAYALRTLGAPGVIFVPAHAAAVKVDAIRRLGAEVRFHGEDSVDTEVYARAHAERTGQVYISPYNDRAIVAGQGTAGAEIATDLPAIDAVYVTVGGGGLVSGVAAALKAQRPDTRVVGCLPANSPVMYESVRAGRIIDMPSLPTLSDGSAGGIEHGTITFALCRALVDDWVLVSEEEIAAAMRLVMETQHLLIEGAAGAAVAGYLKDPQRGRGRTVAVVLCGGNIDLGTLKRVL